MATDDKTEILAAITSLGSYLTNELSGFKLEMSGVKEEMSGFKQAMSGIKQEMSGFKQAISGIKQEMSGIKQDILEMKTSIAGLERSVGALKLELISVRSEIMARVDRLQDRISSVADDIMVNYSAAVKSERLARNAMEDTRLLAEQINAMQIQIRRPSAKVFGPDDLH